MNEITIVEVAGELVVDSRLIAENLEIKHQGFIKLIRKHQAKLEAKFGQVRFEISTVRNSVGAINETVFAWLNEDQSIALMTLCRNTDRVVDLKFDLVEKFQAQKTELMHPVDRALLNELADRIFRQEAYKRTTLYDDLSARIAKLEANKPALPPAVPEMTRAAQVKELVTNYVQRMRCDYEAAWSMLYTKFGLLYHWRADSKSKLSKLAQIEAAGSIDDLYQLALKIFI